MQVDANVSEEHTASIFRDEDDCICSSETLFLEHGDAQHLLRQPVTLSVTTDISYCYYQFS
jgi:hypothetical protein